MKIQFRGRSLQYLIENADAVCKFYVDSSLNDPSITRNNAYFYFNFENLDNVRFVKVFSLPALPQLLTPKQH